ncbi:MAG: ABC-F family ATP-binding cassette domain-containing protein [Bacteroidaceae bacterium]|nr:ABC-F family ATP-binding cassette domain-containing protein [Bacteroidaceae bacterium]MCF0228355.1 ABC-F family ATP-binding cassette domain-containing protein [Parasporobacterium sp.]
MIPLLDIQNLSKRFGERIIINDISFSIGEGEKVGLIAQNGVGKSTLLSIIAGEEPQDSGKVIFRNGIRVGFLHQKQTFNPEETVLQTCFPQSALYPPTPSAAAWSASPLFDAQPSTAAYAQSDAIASDYASEQEDALILKAKQVLTSLKIPNLNQKISQLSGGQQKRVALASVLITEPDLLILDEPTNHLDLEMIEWLEAYLRRGNKTLLMVTHDRYFLDNVCNQIIEIDDNTIYTYRGNFSYYLEKRQQRIDVRNATIASANNLYRKELEWMRRQPQARGHKARYREEAFYELEKIAKQRIQERQVRLKNSNTYIGSKIFECQYVSKSFPIEGKDEPLVILKDFYYNFSRYEKMGIVGNNGAGKSTFIKLLLGLERPDSGQFDIGQTVRFGYFSQEGLAFRPDQRVIDVVRDIAEYINLGNGKHLTAAQLLERFLFSRKQQYDYIEKLSGGEQRKLYLCTVLMQDPNFLILDEPTNDLDIQTLEVLEEYLQDFPGCVIIVSHDRFFTDKIVDHLLVFHGNGNVQDFPGNYSQYRQYQKLSPMAESSKGKEVKESKEGKESREGKDGKEGGGKPRKLSYKEQRELEQLEKDIAALEAEKKTIVEELSAGNISTDRIVKHSKRLPEVEAQLDEKEMRWLELQEMGMAT